MLSKDELGGEVMVTIGSDCVGEVEISERRVSGRLGYDWDCRAKIVGARSLI